MIIDLCEGYSVEGSICDSRDGKRYNIATFGTQVWMTENLDYYDPCVIKSESWCYEYNASNCVKYGRLYTWTADEDHGEFGSERNVRIWSYSETFGYGGGSLMKDEGLSVRCVKD